MERKHVPTLIQVFWLIGFSFSVLSLIFQILLYILIPCSRKLDQKILTQLTVARLLNVVLEFLVVAVEMKNQPIIRDPVFALYVQTDAALICWMFVFTKNLYDKVINVFAQKSSFTIVSVTIWMVTFPIGLLFPFTLVLQEQDKKYEFYFTTCYTVYSVMKFIVLAVNLFWFCRIFKVALSRTDRNVSLLRTCVVSFMLFSVSCFQVLVNDLLSFFLVDQPYVSLAFCAFNSFQVIAITSIFVMLVNGGCEETLTKALAKKFVKVTI